MCSRKVSGALHLEPLMKTFTPPEIVQRICDRIVFEYEPDRVLLFGSYARGTQMPDSDVDLVVISSKEKNLPRYKRGLSTRIALSELDVPKDILFLTEEEFARWEGVTGSLASTISREGVSLYERREH